MQGPQSTITTRSSLPQSTAINQNNSNNSSQPITSSPILNKAFTQPSFKFTVQAQNTPNITATSSQSIISLNQEPAQQSLRILEEKTVPSLKISTLQARPVVVSAGKPTILESKQKSGKSEIIWRVDASTLPTGWKTRTLFWTNREKHFYMSPEGKIMSSRKAVLEFMEQCGTYTEDEFEKVRRGVNKKRKKKTDNDQWVPGRRKQKKKSSSNNKTSGSNNPTCLVNDNNADDSFETSSTNDLDEDEDETSDDKEASIKPCTVRIEKFE